MADGSRGGHGTDHVSKFKYNNAKAIDKQQAEQILEEHGSEAGSMGSSRVGLSQSIDVKVSDGRSTFITDQKSSALRTTGG